MTNINNGIYILVSLKPDITRCPKCDDSVRVIARITAPDTIRYIRIIFAKDYSINSDKRGLKRLPTWSSLFDDTSLYANHRTAQSYEPTRVHEQGRSDVASRRFKPTDQARRFLHALDECSSAVSWRHRYPQG